MGWKKLLASASGGSAAVSSPALCWWTALIALAVVLRLVFIGVSLNHLPPTADEAIVALMAKDIAHGHFPLLFTGQPRLFPVESYLMAPLVDLLPRNAFGARYQMLLQGILCLAGLLLIVRTAYAPGRRWPAALLILFPSAYLLTLTSGYAPPHYPMEMTLAWLSILLLLQWRQSRRPALLALMGLLSGLALSNHMLSVTVSAGIVLLIVFDGRKEGKVTDLALFAAAFGVGMLPYLLAVWTIPGAYRSLPDVVPLPQIIARVGTSLFSESFARAMGINPPLFPDYNRHLDWYAPGQALFAAGNAALLLYLLAERLRAFGRSILASRWPRLELIDLALAASLLTFGVFVAHHTAASDYRYLLSAVLLFPFLVAHAYEKSAGPWKKLVSAAVIVLAACNLAMAGGVITGWSNRATLEKYADTPAIDTLLETLRAQNISHCYASYWLAYRITFESDQNIVCSPVYNERFPFWPIPYKQEVDQASDAVFVLTQTHWARLTALAFQKDLKKAGIGFHVTRVPSAAGSFQIYADFDFPDSKEDQPFDRETYTLKTSGNGEGVASLNDEDFGTSWMSPLREGKEEWLEAVFDRPRLVTSITLFHLKNGVKPPEEVRIFGKKVSEGGEEWQPLAEHVALSPARVGFFHHHPIYGELAQRIELQPALVTALKVEVPKVAAQGAWGFTEVEIAGKALK